MESTYLNSRVIEQIIYDYKSGLSIEEIAKKNTPDIFRYVYFSYSFSRNYENYTNEGLISLEKYNELVKENEKRKNTFCSFNKLDFKIPDIHTFNNRIEFDKITFSRSEKVIKDYISCNGGLIDAKKARNNENKYFVH